MTTRESGGALARFKGLKPHPEESVGLQDDHRAIVDGRTLFRTRVVSTEASERFLISGANNAKIGKMVTKGPWAGMTIYTLTLEERATCPRSCAVYNECYGNGMQWPERRDHRDPDFLDTLRAEVMTKAREHTAKGLVIRLHVLGDFYSMPYLTMWAEMVDRFPQLHLYGYTARREDADDEESRSIAAGIRRLTEAAWDQVAIRFSHAEAGPGRAIVVDSDPMVDGVVVCPAQLEKTATCGTCGLCWSPNARDKTIAFLRHGMRRPGRKLRAPAPVVEPRTDPTLFTKAPARPRGRPPKNSPWFGGQIGTAGDYDLGTPEDRIAKLSAEERDRIAAQYAAAFKPKKED